MNSSLKRAFLSLSFPQMEEMNKCETAQELYELTREYIKEDFSMEELEEVIDHLSSGTAER